MTFHVGQKVVCVDAGHCYMMQRTGLVKDRIYIVEEVVSYGGQLGLIVSGVRSWHMTGAFRADRFRPLIERKTDITIFQGIVRDITERKPVKERA